MLQTSSLSDNMSMSAFLNQGNKTNTNEDFTRNQAAVRILLGSDFQNCTKDHSHIADMRRAKASVLSAMENKLSATQASKADWSDTDEAGYVGATALLAKIEANISMKELEIEMNGDSASKPGNGVIFTKNQRIAKVSNSDLSVGDLMRGMVLGANGNRSIQNALAEGTNSTGGFTVPNELLGGFIDLMRNKSALMSAGAQTVVLSSNKSSMATVLTDPTPGWRAENAAVSESDITFGQVAFAPKSLAVMVKVSRELLADSINISEILMHTLAQAIAGQLDYAGLYGSGTANQPLGLKSVLTTASRLSALATNGSKLSALGYYKPLITAAQKVAQANGKAGAAIMSARTLYDLHGLTDTTGQPLQPPKFVQDELTLVDTNTISDALTQGTSSVASEIFTGDFSNLLLGMRQQLEIDIVRDTFAGNLQIAFIAHLRADWQVARPTGFWLTQGVLAE